MGHASNDKGVNVEIENLHKSDRGQEVLKGIGFKVEPGEVFVIMGPSGGGKSVLLRHVIGLESPDAGEIHIQGEPVCCGQVMAKYRLAMVFQSGALLNSLTVGENVGLYLTEHGLHAPDEIARIVADKLEVVGLKGAESKMPSELSGGMKKRVALARTLVMEPQLILYDEPTSELDPVSAAMIAEEIVKLNRRIGVTSLVVTHDRELAFGIADRIAVMMSGEIVALGAPNAVRDSKNPKVARFLNADIKLSGRNNPHEKFS